MSNIIIKISLVYILVIFAYGRVLSAEIEITSQTMEWKREENIAIASGEAKAVQGNRILNAEKIIVFFIYAIVHPNDITDVDRNVHII